MPLVTIEAIWGVRIALGVKASMGALTIIGHYFSVTDAAINLGVDRFTWSIEERQHIRMTLSASGLAVRRRGKSCLIHEQGDHLAIPYDGQVRFPVAAEAILVCNTGGIENSADFVGRMTINTDRYLFRLLSP
jgi:hypothetical protein